MLSKKLAIDVLNESLSTGADYAEIFFEDSHSHSVSIENGKVESSSSNSMCGVGLRLLKENQCVYGYTNDVTRKGLFALANSLNKSFNNKSLITVTKLEQIKAKNRNPIARSYDDVTIEERISLLKEGIDEIENLHDPRLVRYGSHFISNHRHVEVYNSKEKWFHRDTEFGRMIFEVIAADENGFETGFVGPGAQQDISYFHRVVNPKDCAKEAVRVALQNLNAKECPSGVMPVIVGNGWGGVLFHESCGHPLEASAVAKELSCFNGQYGKQIASPIVSAVDDSTLPQEWGSIDIDDEGNLDRKSVV